MHPTQIHTDQWIVTGSHVPAHTNNMYKMAEIDSKNDNYIDV